MVIKIFKRFILWLTSKLKRKTQIQKDELIQNSDIKIDGKLQNQDYESLDKFYTLQDFERGVLLRGSIVMPMFHTNLNFHLSVEKVLPYKRYFASRVFNSKVKRDNPKDANYIYTLLIDEPPELKLTIEQPVGSQSNEMQRIYRDSNNFFIRYSPNIRVFKKYTGEYIEDEEYFKFIMNHLQVEKREKMRSLK